MGLPRSGRVPRAAFDLNNDKILLDLDPGDYVCVCVFNITTFLLYNIL